MDWYLKRTLALALILFSACATQPVRQDLESRARAAVTALVADFEGNDAEAFFSHFDPRLISNFSEYRYSVSQVLLHNHQFNISMIIDAVLTEGNGNEEKAGWDALLANKPIRRQNRGAQVAVQAHWSRSYVNQAGVYQRDSGRCEFIFYQRPRGGVLLIGIHGDSPFSGESLNSNVDSSRSSPPPDSDSARSPGVLERPASIRVNAGATGSTSQLAPNPIPGIKKSIPRVGE